MGGTVSSHEPLRRSRAASLRVDPALAAVMALTLGAALVRFAWIGRQGFWFDEANSAMLAHRSLAGMLGLLPQSESTPPLYYCLAWAWVRVFGDHEAALRSLSALAGVATVPALYAAVRTLGSRRAAAVAAALATCDPLLVWYSQEARAYALLVLFGALGLLAWARAVEDLGRRRLVTWSVVSALSLLTHYYAVLAVAPQAVWLLVAARARGSTRRVAWALAGVGACAVTLLPLAVAQVGTNHTRWISRVSVLRRLGQVAPQFVVGFGPPAGAVLEPVAVALVAAALAAVILPWPGRPAGVRMQTLLRPGLGAAERRVAMRAGALALAGLALELALVAAGIDDLLTRNLLALWPAAAAAVASGLAALGTRRAALGAAVLCAIGLVGVAGVDFDRNRQRPDWRVVARVLGPFPSERTDRLILVQHYRDLLPLSLYLRGLKALHRGGARVDQLDVVAFSSPPSAGFCWWGSACNLWPSRLQSSYRLAGLHPAWRRRRLQFTVLQLDARHPVWVTVAEVSHALRSTRWHQDELLLQRP